MGLTVCNRVLCRWPQRNVTEYDRDVDQLTFAERRYESDIRILASRAVPIGCDLRRYYQRRLHCYRMDFRSVDTSHF